jgi:hypothetical protein
VSTQEAAAKNPAPKDFVAQRVVAIGNVAEKAVAWKILAQRMLMRKKSIGKNLTQQVWTQGTPAKEIVAWKIAAQTSSA